MPRYVIGIDPGPDTSGVVVYDAQARKLVQDVEGVSLAPDVPNDEVEDSLDFAWRGILNGALLAMEFPACYGMRVGRGIFDRCFWVGRFWRRWADAEGCIELLTRPEVCYALTGHRSQPKAAVRAVLYDRFGGSRKAALGRKDSPGPLYGITKHQWDALAVAYVAAGADAAREKACTS